MRRDRDLIALLILCFSVGAGITIVRNDPELVGETPSPIVFLLSAAIYGTQSVFIATVITAAIAAGFVGLSKIASAPRELKLCALIVDSMVAYLWWVSWLMGPAYVESDLLVGHDPLTDRDIALIRLGGLTVISFMGLGTAVAYRRELSNRFRQRGIP